MDTAIRIEMLPARHGDCLVVECPREDGTTWRMLVDGGPPDTWPRLEARLAALAPADRIDVAVITHIDSDHIGGMIPFLASHHAARVDDFWFNGRQHLPDAGRRSVAQGESVVASLLGEDTGRVLPWNRAFDGGPLDTGEQAGFVEVPVPGGPHITILSPTTKRLRALAATWQKAVDDALRGTEEDAERDVLEPLDDLAAMAAQTWPKDGSAANGSSVALLVEHRGARVVLGADAYGTVLGAGLAGVAASRGLDALPVHAFKLPHHGSRANVFEALLRAAPAGLYLVSTNGDTFHHPDDAALARVVLNAAPDAGLVFNYENARTKRWGDAALRSRHDYRVLFPEPGQDGVRVDLPAVP